MSFIETKIDHLAEMVESVLEKLNSMDQKIIKLDPGKKEWLSTPEACSLLSCSKATLQRLRFSGKIKSSKVQNKVYHSRESILRLIQDGK